MFYKTGNKPMRWRRENHLLSLLKQSCTYEWGLDS